MKKLLVISILAICFCPLAFAGTSLTTTINANPESVFSLEFYNDANVLFNSTLPFTDMLPEEYVYPDGRAESDGKSDVGLLVKTNHNQPWKLNMKIGVGDLAGKVAYYMQQPINRNTSGSASGGLGHAVGWVTLLTSDDTIYNSGGSDNLCTPFGILSTLSFKMDARTLEAKPYTSLITYTLVEII